MQRHIRKLLNQVAAPRHRGHLLLHLHGARLPRHCRPLHGTSPSHHLIHGTQRHHACHVSGCHILAAHRRFLHHHFLRPGLLLVHLRIHRPPKLIRPATPHERHFECAAVLHHGTHRSAHHVSGTHRHGCACLHVPAEGGSHCLCLRLLRRLRPAMHHHLLHRVVPAIMEPLKLRRTRLGRSSACMWGARSALVLDNEQAHRTRRRDQVR